MNAAQRYKLMTPAEKAKLVTDAKARIIVADRTPMAQMQRLFKAASPENVRWAFDAKTSEHNEQLRRCYVLRAFAAVACLKLARASRYAESVRYWRAEARAALKHARWCKQVSRSFAEVGR